MNKEELKAIHILYKSLLKINSNSITYTHYEQSFGGTPEI